MLPLLSHVLIVQMYIEHGALDLRVTQTLPHIADVPITSNQLGRMSVP